MNIYGPYTTTTVEGLQAGHVFACSSYGSPQPLLFVGIKAVLQKDTNGAIILSRLFSQGTGVTPENKDLYFDSVDRIGDQRVLDITSVVSLLPDINSFVDRGSYKEIVPSGAVVFLEDQAHIVHYVQGKGFSPFTCLANLKTGAIQKVTDDLWNRASICLKWDLLAHAGTTLQTILCRYDRYPAQTDET